MAPKSSLSKCIATPSRLVNLLNWKKESVVMALSITDSNIGMAYASTPRETMVCTSDFDFYSTNRPSASHQNSDRSIHTLEPIQYMKHAYRNDYPLDPPLGIKGRRKRETRRIAEELRQVVDDVRASAFLVTWPLNTISGKPGRDCGTVLHVLDAMTGTIIRQSKPCMLWDCDRDQQTSLVCSDRETKSGLNPLKCWLSNEQTLKRNLKLLEKQQEGQHLQINRDNKNARDESDVARVALKDFLDLNWPICTENGTIYPTKDALELLGRNHMLNGSFETIENPQEAQMRLLM